jgi:hypothetical protein
MANALAEEICERVSTGFVFLRDNDGGGANTERVSQIISLLKRKWISCAAGVSNAILSIIAAKSCL